MTYARNENLEIKCTGGDAYATKSEEVVVINILIGAIIGLVSGVASGFFGIGGGVIMVPAFMFFFGLDIKKAIGTSLLVIVPTAIAGGAKYVASGNADWKVFLTVAAFAVIGGYVGAVIVNQKMNTDLLARLFGGLLIIVGVVLVWHGPLNQESVR